MKTEQRLWTADKGWEDVSPERVASPQLVFAFGGRPHMEDAARFKELRERYPNPAHVILCSTAGEILGTRVQDSSICVTAIQFNGATVQVVETDITKSEESLEAGARLAEMLPKEGLVHAMVFSDGLRVNGTALVKGLNDHLPAQVSVTGGLVGDAADFKKTVVGLDKVASEGKIVLVGFYGAGLKVGYGSLGGWDTFGVERMITKSKNNVLYELDGKPALELYKTYLGDKAEGLPGTALLFPLRLRVKGDGAQEKEGEVVRTVLGVDEKAQSMTFAGDMPEGGFVSLMKANFERLIDGASGAGGISIEPLGAKPAELAILISCIGRKLVLKERTEEEVEAVRAAIGAQAAMVGFYSYGELCPTAATEKQCRLHNQTMTITTFREE